MKNPSRIAIAITTAALCITVVTPVPGLGQSKNDERSEAQTAKVAATVSPDGVAAGSTKVNPKDGLTYVWIPPGTFTMGCSPGDNECFENEEPAHQVTLTRGFWIGQTEVTQGGSLPAGDRNQPQRLQGREASR
jgi:formylglycine-generating enzyme required for sulfatase activity